MIVDIFNIIAPVFACAGIGFFWARSGAPFDTRFISRLVINVGFPCLMFVSLATVDLDTRALGVMGVAGFVTTLFFGVVGYPLLKAARADWRAYLPSIMFANTGNMGLPLCLLAFGEEGLALGVAYFAANAIIFVALAPAISSRELKAMDALKSPLIWSCVGGAAVKLADVSLPVSVTTTLKLIGGFPIPLMLIALGVSLAQLKTSGLWGAGVVAVFRLVLGMLTGWGFAELIDADPVTRGILIIECAMPAAVFNFLMANIHNTRPGEVAGIVLISTLLSFLTLPALLWFILPG